ncbi:MAG: SEL1-like repeat protein [Thiolinea sp.]
MAVQAETPVVTTVLDEAPPPWDGTVRQGAATSGSTQGGGIAEWYRQRMSRSNLPGQQIQSLQARANGGDANAMYQLGMLYQSGQGVAADQGRARQLFEQAARAGEPSAQYSLALLYRQQNDPSLLQQSVNWQQKAAQQGHVEAQYGLGMLYANGQYVPRDLYKARHWLQQAVERNHSIAGLALQDLGNAAARPQQVAATPVPRLQPQQPQQVSALTPMPEVTPPPVVRPVSEPVQVQQPQVEQQESSVSLEGQSSAEIRRAAEKGDMYAQMMYGALLEDGAGGVQQDYAQAMRWYLKAAKQGYPKAQHNLALLYEDGKGVPQDYAQAAIWYKKAAAEGFSEAQNNLAVLYILGNGVEADRSEAERLLRQAVAQGNENAKRNLDMLINGEG